MQQCECKTERDGAYGPFVVEVCMMHAVYFKKVRDAERERCASIVAKEFATMMKDGSGRVMPTGWENSDVDEARIDVLKQIREG